MDDAASLERRIADFPLDPVLRRYGDASGVSPDQVRRLERELKRYLALAAAHPTMEIPIAKTLDSLWHAFLIYTPIYHEFCGRMGRGFIHHIPSDAGFRHARRLMPLEELRSVYEREFGEPPAEDLWPAGLEEHDCYANTDVP